MRKILIIVFTAICSFANAQQNNTLQRTITVNGSAEMEVIPDEIYLQVDLREYDKKGVGKIDIETIKADFISACKKVEIADSLISINELSGISKDYWSIKKRKKDDLKAAISYWVKLDSPEKMEKLIDQLDDESTANFFVAKVSHSKTIMFRKQLKIQAIKAAKEKAIYLSEAINEKVSGAITITEPRESTSDDINRYSNGNSFDNARLNGLEKLGNNLMTVVNFKKIKLRFEVSVVFALQ